ncbi:MAG: CPBP family intramembrane glutamic endopeptidase [Cyanobacteria bacterium P01_F01_bin.150]
MTDHSSYSPYDYDSTHNDDIGDGKGSKNPFLSMRRLLWGFFGAIILGGLSASFLWESLWAGIHFATGLEELPPGFSSLMMLLGIQGGMAVFAWRRLRQAGVNIGQMMGSFPPTYNWVGGIGWAIALIMFTFSFMATIAYGAVALFPDTISEAMKNLFTALAQETNPFWINIGMAMMGTIVAPLVEEFTFRGLFWHYWSARRSIQTGLLLTALLFASLHPQNFVGMFVFSLVLSLLYLRTRSLWVPIGIHAIYNGIIFSGDLLSAVTENKAGTTAMESPEALAEEAVNEMIAAISQAQFGIVAGLFLLIAIFLIFRFMYKNWPQKSAPLPYFRNKPEL